MTDVNKSSMPFMVEMKTAVDAIVSGLAADTPVIAFPSSLYLIASTLAFMPEGVKETLARLTPALGYLRARRSKK